MENVIIIRYGEIFLKGKNFAYFENKLVDNIYDAIKEYKCDLLISETTAEGIIADESFSSQ